MSPTSTRTELVLLDRSLARLLERRRALLHELAPTREELRRQHTDLVARPGRRDGGPELSRLFERIDDYCLAPEGRAEGKHSA